MYSDLLKNQFELELELGKDAMEFDECNLRMKQLVCASACKDVTVFDLMQSLK